MSNETTVTNWRSKYPKLYATMVWLWAHPQFLREAGLLILGVVLGAWAF